MLPLKVQNKFFQKLQLLLLNNLDPTLNIHPLHGKYKGFSSMNVTGDYRAIFIAEGDVTVFEAIGTHSELY